MGGHSLNRRVPFLSSLYVWMIIPSVTHFAGALITSILISTYDSVLGEDCHERIRAFLFGCIILLYSWVIYHFYVLFGLPWKNLPSKLAVFGAFVVMNILWIIYGHITLQIEVTEACVRRTQS